MNIAWSFCNSRAWLRVNGRELVGQLVELVGQLGTLVSNTERFLVSKVDVKGQHYELIPFGAGRRMCVGLPLGHRMMYFTLGLLLHEFDWELPDGISPKSTNMDESLGGTSRKRDSLKTPLPVQNRYLKPSVIECSSLALPWITCHIYFRKINVMPSPNKIVVSQAKPVLYIYK
ncbi:Geraniol 8-hydroxylase [Capsicum chinense]|nr:Geraniol 8-hydroxylase [Capsicum chinense]